MITTGPGLMRAASILHYYKRLAQHDLINFSEKFGTPGLVVHTTAGKDSPEGQAAANLARGLAGNYRGVQYGAAENKIEIVWPDGRREQRESADDRDHRGLQTRAGDAVPRRGSFHPVTRGSGRGRERAGRGPGAAGARRLRADRGNAQRRD